MKRNISLGQEQNETANTVKNILENNKSIRLEIGSGPNKRINWITLDLDEGCDITYDLTNGIPFPNETVDMIYSSHLLEHFYYNNLLSLLEECHRVLKINGIFSLCVPDASIYIKKYIDPNGIMLGKLYEPAFNHNSSIDFINYIAYMDGNHRYMFDEENIPIILKKSGFANIKKREFDPEIDLFARSWESLYFDSWKLTNEQ